MGDPPPSPSGAPTDHPYTYWGGGEGSSSISPLLRNSGAPSALKQIVHKSSYLYSLFHSVIYNSVLTTKMNFPNGTVTEEAGRGETNSSLGFQKLGALKKVLFPQHCFQRNLANICTGTVLLQKVTKMCPTRYKYL